MEARKRLRVCGTLRNFFNLRAKALTKVITCGIETTEVTAKVLVQSNFYTRRRVITKKPKSVPVINHKYRKTRPVHKRV